MVGEGSAEIFDLFQHCRADVELDVDFTVDLLLFGAEVGHLQFDLAELGDDVMEAVAQNGLVLLLEDLKIQLLKKFILSLYQFLLADPEQNSYFRR